MTTHVSTSSLIVISESPALSTNESRATEPFDATPLTPHEPDLRPLSTFPDPAWLAGNDKRMREIRSQIALASRSSTTVLIHGETGTGKEFIAQAIHDASSLRDKPFIKINCAALSKSLVPNEFPARRRSRFSLPHLGSSLGTASSEGGTIFLEDVCSAPPAMQIELLKILEDVEFERFGATRQPETEVRVLAGTHRDIEAMTKIGLFREDLYFRLNVFDIAVPPLRERSADIPLLAHILLAKHSRQRGGHIRRLAQSALDLLQTFRWPGNVRELESCIERAVLVAKGDAIQMDDLPRRLRALETPDVNPGSLRNAVETLERSLLIEALKQHRGIKAAAARSLGLTERVMGLRVSKYNIDANRYKEPTWPMTNSHLARRGRAPAVG